MNPLFAALGTSIFETMSGLAREKGAVNLGQGFPDFGWPDDVVAKAAGGLSGAASQYPPMRGLPELRRAVADHYRAHQGVDLDPEQVIVTSGATEAIAASLIALIAPGD
ncbi:MAG TPA: aminotransferase class I/II-fold pyridoxal phosphate-dependent enzyme, partial [Allosphingosinicella sp.]|nr:aminotransferase class I/II-fold pyridoxal phosphate-dependent enzyme [Allosphingosinicella sp.]